MAHPAAYLRAQCFESASSASTLNDVCHRFRDTLDARASTSTQRLPSMFAQGNAPVSASGGTSAWDVPTADLVPVPPRLSQLTLRKRGVSFRPGAAEGDTPALVKYRDACLFQVMLLIGTAFHCCVNGSTWLCELLGLTNYHGKE